MLAALEPLVLPGMVLTLTVLVFSDPLEDAKAPVLLDEVVWLLRWCRTVLVAMLMVPWRRLSDTLLLDDVPIEPSVVCCWRKLAEEKALTLLEVRHRWWRTTALAFFCTC